MAKALNRLGNREQSRDQGYSLSELLVAIVIMGILAGIAVPRLARLTATFNRSNARASVIQDLRRAQAQALTEGCRGVLTVAANGTSYSYGCDYLEYNPSVPPTADAVSFVRILPEHITVSVDNTIIYNSRGQSVEASGTMQNVTISLRDGTDGPPVEFASGILLGTGVFSIN